MADIVPAPPGTWQAWLQQQAAALGLTETSGYRSPGSNAAAGGSPTSYHMTGTPTEPGAIDIGGSAAQLTLLFNQIKVAFSGRINELYLNLPGGGSQDIRNNQTISSNPEAGNPQHLHVSLSGIGAAPAAAIPQPNRGAAALRAAPIGTGVGGGGCYRQVCPPDLRGTVSAALGQTPAPQTNCLCWSDLWAYGVAGALIVGGAWMLMGPARSGA